jgi:hypothetical protein
MVAELDFVKLFFAPVVPFISHPERIAVVAVTWFVAAALLTFWRMKFAWPSLITGVVWAVFAAWEGHCVRMGYDIRVDLFLINPLLIAFTIFGVAGLFISDPQQLTFRRQFSLRGLLILMTLIALLSGAVMWFIKR